MLQMSDQFSQPLATRSPVLSNARHVFRVVVVSFDVVVVNSRVVVVVQRLID